MMKLSDPKGGDGESRKLQHEAEANLAHARVKIEATADGTVGQGNDPAAAAATTVAELDLALPPARVRSRVLSDPHDLMMQQPERFIGSDVSISLESRATVTAVTDHYVVVRLHPESGPDYIRIGDFCFLPRHEDEEDDGAAAAFVDAAPMPEAKFTELVGKVREAFSGGVEGAHPRKRLRALEDLPSPPAALQNLAPPASLQKRVHLQQQQPQQQQQQQQQQQPHQQTPRRRLWPIPVSQLEATNSNSSCSFQPQQPTGAARWPRTTVCRPKRGQAVMARSLLADGHWRRCECGHPRKVPPKQSHQKLRCWSCKNRYGTTCGWRLTSARNTN